MHIEQAKPSRRMRVSIAVLSVGFFSTCGIRANAQIFSTRILATGANDWFNSAAWDNGVPKNPGDTADLQLPSGTVSQLTLGSSVALEQLLVSGRGTLNLVGSGPLAFKNVGAGPLLFELLPSGANLEATVSTFVSLNDAQPLFVNIPAQSSIQWNGNFVSSAGDLVKTGAGLLRLSSNNDRWAGEVIVGGGKLVVSTSTALGSPSRGVSVHSGGILALETSSAEPLNVNDGAIHVLNLELSGPLALEGDAFIFRPMNPLTSGPRPSERTLGPTLLSGRISGVGNLTLQNLSRDAVSINGDNTYTGHTYVTAGQVLATTPNALGSSGEGTTIQGGSLTLQALTGERFRVEGGQLRFGAGSVAPTAPIEVAGGDVYFPSAGLIATPIVVDGIGGGVNAVASSTSWIGGSTGIGSLRLGGRINVDAPLAHQGDVIIERAQLNVANNYTGDTYVTEEATINHVGALGQSTNVYVQKGFLRLNVLPDGAPHYYVQSGGLGVPNSSQFADDITMGGAGETYLSSDAVYVGEINLVRKDFNRNQIWEGTFNGHIRGDGMLQLGNAPDKIIRLNTANDIGGPVEVRNSVVQLNHPNALDLASTYVSGGRLNLNVPTIGNVITTQDFYNIGTVAFNAPQTYSDPWVVHLGTLEVAAEVGMSKLILLGGQINTLGSGTLRIDGEARIQQSARITGRVTGDGVIRNFAGDGFLSGDYSEFDGEIRAEHGELFASAYSYSSRTTFHVESDATLRFSSYQSDVVVASDIFVHNAHGDQIGYRGGLNNGNSNSVRLRGRVDVGEEGSTMVGNFTVEGLLTGSNLVIKAGGMTIASPQDQLRGVLRVTGQGAVSIDGQGLLRGLDSILIEGGSTLDLGPNSVADRVDDTIEIKSRGGFLSLVSGASAATRETLRNLKLERGNTRIFVSSDHGSPPAGLTINSVARDRGSILSFRQAGFQNTTRILDGLALHNDIIGPWAVTDGGFATLSANGDVQTKIPMLFSDLNAAGSQDHVRISGDHSLSADKTIASLQYDSNGDPASLNLNGHQLTVLSGGVFRSQEIHNGRLTAGETGDAELVFHQALNVSADIVDNSGGGSVGLVISSTGMRLSGNNSYTGGTWVVGSEYYPGTNAKATIESLSAIPFNDRVYVDNGVYELQPITSGVVSLAELHIRNGGSVSGSFLALLDVRQMVLEDGELIAKLTGNGSIVKHTDGTVDFTNSKGDAFTGTVDVFDGQFIVRYDTLPQATFIIEGGQLDVSGDRAATNSVVLKGGTIGAGFFSGHIDIQSDSQLFHNGFTSFFGNITGSGDLTIRGTQNLPFDQYVGFFGNASQYSGNIRVESGAFRVGTPSNAGTGIITVEEAGRLILGSNSYSNPATSISNEIHLRGGTLYSTPPSNGGLPGIASPSVTTGNVFVHEEAFIGALRRGVQAGKYLPGLTIAGQLILSNGAHVYGLSDTRHQVALGDVALVDIAGELLVGANTTWHLLTSSLSISGVIRPSSTAGSINFVGIRQLLRLEGAGIRVDAGQSLAIKLNGKTAPLTLSGLGNNLAGDGTLVGDFTIINEGAVVPGNSPGILTIQGDVTMGAAGKLSIEIAGQGPGSQYDRLDVLGNVVLDGALLDLSMLNGFIPSNNDAFVILRGSSITGRFANAIDRIEVGGRSLPVTYRSQMIILGNALAIPEPSNVLLLLLLAAAVAGMRWRVPSLIPTAR